MQFFGNLCLLCARRATMSWLGSNIRVPPHSCNIGSILPARIKSAINYYLDDFGYATNGGIKTPADDFN